MDSKKSSMNKTFFLREEDKKPQWRVIDATGKVVGRLASDIATILRGKDKPAYTPHSDAGDYVVVINVEKIVFTGDKMRDKEYVWHTGWIGHKRSLTARQVMEKDPTRILRHAVKGMLAPTKLARAQMKKLRMYKGSEHPHAAQVHTSQMSTSKA